MKIESEYNGIQHGELCWVWDNNESKGMEAYFLAYIDNGVNVTGKSWAARCWLARFVHGKSYV